MSSLPLFDTPANPDASHNVRAPGGYEWWYFDAEDPATDTQIVAIFLNGFIFHPGYLRDFARYSKNPTQTPPPIPEDYACMYFCVYRGGKIAHQFMTQYPRSQVSASSDQVNVVMGPNQLISRDGALRVTLSGTPWKLTWQGPKRLLGQTLSGSFIFRPTFLNPASQRVFLSHEMTCAAHEWVLSQPHCDVSGAIEVGGETISFNGRGYHDHNFGTAPIGPGLGRWIWGRVLLDDRVVTFHYAVPHDRALPDEVHLVEASADGVEAVAVQKVSADWSRRTAVGLRYPDRLAFDDRLVLSNPRVIDSSPFYMRLIYEAQIGARTGHAFCEVAYPHRLRWPILGRMIEMSIDRSAMIRR